MEIYLPSTRIRSHFQFGECFILRRAAGREHVVVFVTFRQSSPKKVMGRLQKNLVKPILQEKST